MKRNISIKIIFVLILHAACTQNDSDSGSDAGMDAEASADSGENDASAKNDSGCDSGMDAGVDGGDGEQWPGAPWYGCTEDDEPESAETVTVFDLADHYFNPEDRRLIETEVDFPESGGWNRISLRIELSCPADGDCDNWDRFANLMLVENPGGADEEVFEIERYITPYNVGMCMLTDVTRFAPRLEGRKTIRSFIDTWVGPDEAVHGHGWRITVKFIFYAQGQGEEVPEELIQLWSYQDVEVGNPLNPVSRQLEMKKPVILQNAGRVELRVLTTGHGQGNLNNCAEFCNLQQVITVNSEKYEYDPWRDDCDENPIGSLQSGTWSIQRSGWCPGAYVIPHVFDITDAVIRGGENTIKYDIIDWNREIYENTCRPDAGTDAGVCEGCEFNNSPGNCNYNGMDHTMPADRISVQMLVYR